MAPHGVRIGPDINISCLRQTVSLLQFEKLTLSHNGNVFQPVHFPHCLQTPFNLSKLLVFKVGVSQQQIRISWTMVFLHDPDIHKDGIIYQGLPLHEPMNISPTYEAIFVVRAGFSQDERHARAGHNPQRVTFSDGCRCKAEIISAGP